MMRVRYLLLGLLLSVAAVASAQFMPPGFKMPSMRYNPALLMNPDVQKDMNISPSVSQKVTEVMMQEGMKMLPTVMGAMSGKKQTPDEEKKMMTVISAAYDSMQSKTIVLLSPPQRKRLHEITLQSTGASALLDPSIASEVGLTATQSSRLASAISRINRQNSGGSENPFQGGGTNPAALKNFAGKAASMAKKTKAETEAAASAILTPTQKIMWIRLQGRHIDLKGVAGMGGMFGGM